MEVVDGGLKNMASQLFEVLVSPPVPKSAREQPLLTSGIGGSGGGSIGGTSTGSLNGSGTASAGGGSAGTGSGSTRGGSGAAVGGVGADGTGGVIGPGKGGGSGVGGSQDVAGGGTGGGGGGAQEALVLDYGDVYEGKLYQRRSFVIVNHSTMPLEFQLSSSLPVSELNFSLSAVTLKQFKSVHVESKTRLQVGVIENGGKKFSHR